MHATLEHLKVQPIYAWVLKLTHLNIYWKKSLASDLINVNSWCDLNRMSINVAETKMMIISSKQNANRIQNSLPSIELNNEKINHSSHENLLGITKTLAWEKQVDIVLKM